MVTFSIDVKFPDLQRFQAEMGKRTESMIADFLINSGLMVAENFTDVAGKHFDTDYSSVPRITGINKAGTSTVEIDWGGSGEVPQILSQGLERGLFPQDEADQDVSVTRPNPLGIASLLASRSGNKLWDRSPEGQLRAALTLSPISPRNYDQANIAFVNQNQVPKLIKLFFNAVQDNF